MSVQSPAPTLLRRCLRVATRLLLTVIALIFLLFLLAISGTHGFVFEIPIHVIAGWFWYLKRVTAQISINRGLMISSAACLLIAMVLLQRCMTWLCNRRQPKAEWRWKNTVAVTLLLLVLFAASIAGTGIGHQLAWLGKQPVIQSSFGRYGFINNSRQLALVLRSYAEDHDGQYPSSLGVLVPGGYLDNEEDLYQLLLWSSEPGGDLEPLTYLGQRLTKKSPDHLPLLVSPRRTAATGKWQVIRVGGDTMNVADKELDRLMEEWRRITQAQSAE